MKNKKLICIILVLSLLLAVISACGTDETGVTDNNSGENLPGHQDGEQDEAEAPNARLPFEPAELDLGGRNFNFATCGWGAETTSEQRCVTAEEETGDGINDAVYRRNSVIEELFNITITENRYPGPGEMTSGVRNSVNAGDAQFDAMYLRFREHMSNFITHNILFDLKDMPHLNLENPWWDQNIIEQTSISGKLFAANGDIQILDKGAINAFVFNKQLQAEYQIEDLYELVKSGSWTLGKLLEISKQVSADLNGDGIMDDNDRYGLLYYRDGVPAFFTGANEFIARKDADDLPYMSFDTERVWNVLDAMYEVIYDESVAFHTMRAFGDAGFIIEGGRMFQNSQALLMYIRMTEIEGLRGMETDFGILPFPKYDGNQQNYLSLVNPWIGSALAVPVTADIDASSAVLEAMAYESRYTLLPAYYDITLQTKIARDDDSEAMLDIIFNNMAYDIGGIFGFGDIVNELMYHTMNLRRTMLTFYERSEVRAQRDIDRLTDAVLNMD